MEWQIRTGAFGKGTVVPPHAPEASMRGPSITEISTTDALEHHP